MSTKQLEIRRALLNRMQSENQQFPGVGPGTDPQKVTTAIETMRSYIRNQKKSKGFKVACSAGSVTEQQINISGEARIMLGLAYFPGFKTSAGTPVIPFDLGPDQFTLQVNNEIIIDHVYPAFISPEYMDEEYYQFLRPLNGSDDIVVKFNNPTATAVDAYLVFYYL